eukprot:4373146-Prymnesium_polylepis.1
MRLSLRWFGKSSTQRLHTAADALQVRLERLRARSRSHRRKVSGSILAAGGIFLVSSQVWLFLSVRLEEAGAPSWLRMLPVPFSLLPPMLLLLALRPSDRQ